MPLLNASLVLLLTIVHLPYPSLTQEVPETLPPAPNSTSWPQDQPHSDSRVRRDSDKRAREFVGKRSAPTHDESEVFVLPLNTGEQFTPQTFPNALYDTVEKRPRQFVGKRLRDFVGKRSSEFDLLNPYDKRLRDFVGKRDEDNVLEKRLRDFVGKRDSLGDNMYFEEDKRPRQFVGKRFSEDSRDDWIRDDKRPRQFLGKRGLEDREEVELEKRLRDFVGKRARQFVGKRDFDSENAQELVGENSSFYDDSDSSDPVPVDDRVRVGKRIREFIGKRSINEEAGVERATSESRDGEGTLQLAKRIREFIGKRLATDSDAMLPNVKRLRDFVGKRNGYVVEQSIEDAESTR